MVDRVVEALKLVEDLDTYVIVTNFSAELNHPVIRLERPTVGATETVLLSLQKNATILGGGRDLKDTSLLLLDCDAIYHCDIIAKFRELESSVDVAAGVLCFRELAEEKNSKPKYSYVAADNDGNIFEIAEKERVGPLANTGAYWFASCKEFEETAQRVIQRGEFQLGEAYISCVLREYLKSGKTIRAVIVDEDSYSNIGTPEYLERYLRNQGYAFLFDLDGTLVDTTAAYVQAWRILLSSKGAYVDEDFFVRHISGLSDAQVSENLKIPVSSSAKDYHFLQHISCVKEIDGAVDFVRKCQKIGLVHVVTNSNKAAALALLQRLGLDDIPLLTAQDVRFGKPNREPYTKAMYALGVSPKKCLIFEDSRGGVISGRSALAKYVIAVSNNLKNCDSFIPDFKNFDPSEIIRSLVSVAHLSDELSEMLGQHSTVFPLRASGGYISEILSASSGSRSLVIKQENDDHGVLQEVSENLHLHTNECIFYRDFAKITPVRTATFYGILPKSCAIVMEDLRRYDRAPEFSLESGLKVIKSIAKHHAHFSGAPLGELSIHSKYMKTHVLGNYQNFRAKWSSTISMEAIKLLDHAVEYFDDAEAQLLAPPSTLLHGDLKFPNLFWDSGAGAGEPIFIDWQYAGPGKGIEDIIFLLVESCGSNNFHALAGTLIEAYYMELQKYSDVEVPMIERRAQVSCALAGFPLFVAVWFGCIDASRLTDPNFPFLYILRLANAFTQLYDVDWVRFKLQ